MTRNKKSRGGFTLLEVIIATALTLLLFFGALNVYVAAAQMTVSTSASCYAITDGANAVQHTVRDSEEARWLALPGGTGWTSPGSAPVSAFQTTDSGALINTGVQLVYPAAAVVSVQNRSGGSLTVTPFPYDRSQDLAPMRPLYIYRSNSDGTPNAASGMCLWMYGTEQGQSVNKALLSSLNASQANAVSFSRPLTTTSVMLPYQLQINLVSTYYSPLKQAQTSEINSTSQETYVVGKCVLLRDHEMNLDHEPGSTAGYTAVNSPTLRSD
ncbi:MAG: PilW family protein [Janthinobacterium lividum]